MVQDDAEVQIDQNALKKAKDDAVAAHIKILENFYSFLIGFALTQATMKLVDAWIASGWDRRTLGQCVLFVSLIVTIVPFYQGMNRFLYATHVVRPIEKPKSRSSPMLFDIYAFLLMSCIIFAMGRFLGDPTIFFYLWTLLLCTDVAWTVIVWRIQKGRAPIWARNNLIWLVLAWVYWASVNWTAWPNVVPVEDRNALAYGFVFFEVLRTAFDYRINWKFYFPPEYRGN